MDHIRLREILSELGLELVKFKNTRHNLGRSPERAMLDRLNITEHQQ